MDGRTEGRTDGRTKRRLYMLPSGSIKIALATYADSTGAYQHANPGSLIKVNAIRT